MIFIIAMVGGLATVTLQLTSWLCCLNAIEDNADDYNVFAR